MAISKIAPMLAKSIMNKNRTRELKSPKPVTRGPNGGLVNRDQYYRMTHGGQAPPSGMMFTQDMIRSKPQRWLPMIKNY